MNILIYLIALVGLVEVVWSTLIHLVCKLKERKLFAWIGQGNNVRTRIVAEFLLENGEIVSLLELEGVPIQWRGIMRSFKPRIAGTIYFLDEERKDVTAFQEYLPSVGDVVMLHISKPTIALDYSGSRILVVEIKLIEVI